MLKIMIILRNTNHSNTNIRSTNTPISVCKLMIIIFLFFIQLIISKN